MISHLFPHSLFSQTTSEMFSRFFKSKFYKKSKSCLKNIKVKVEFIRKRRNAVQKFLKNDIAEFLRRGLHYNAYQRAARLLMEYNKSFCYELIEKYSGCVLNHLDDLSKQRDCPDECKEAVQTLIYAAARIGDLPDLRELRNLFTHNHNYSFEPYLNKEFVSKLRQDLPARETTIQFLHDIAAEFSIQWDSNALIQQIYRPLSPCDEEEEEEEGRKDEERSNKGEADQNKDGINIYESGDEDDGSRISTDLWSQDGKRASSSSSLPSVSEEEEDDELPENLRRPFSSGRVPAPYRLEPKPNHKVEGNNLQNEEKPQPKPMRKGQSVRTIRSGAPRARHVHPKLPDFDDLDSQLSSLRVRPIQSEEEEDDELPEKLQRPFSSGRVPAPYCLEPKPNHKVEGNNLQNEEKPQPKPIRKGQSVRTIRSGAPRAKHVHPKLPDFDDLDSQLSSLRARPIQSGAPTT